MKGGRVTFNTRRYLVGEQGRESYLSWGANPACRGVQKREVAIYHDRSLIKQCAARGLKKAQRGKKSLYLPSGDIDSMTAKLTCLHQKLLFQTISVRKLWNNM